MAASPASMRIIIVIAFIGIIISLGSALVFLVRDRGNTNRTVNALTVRVGLSVALFLFILFSYWMGWIEPRSY
jgi:branched-subunit amino acid transport protein AzlD